MTNKKTASIEERIQVDSYLIKEKIKSKLIKHYCFIGRKKTECFFQYLVKKKEGKCLVDARERRP